MVIGLINLFPTKYDNAFIKRHFHYNIRSMECMLNIEECSNMNKMKEKGKSHENQFSGSMTV